VGALSSASCRELREALAPLDGNLLIDGKTMNTFECAQLLLSVRPILPRTAIVGGDLASFVAAMLPGKDYYQHELRCFESEDDAIAWLHGDPPASQIVPMPHQQQDVEAVV